MDSQRKVIIIGGNHHNTLGVVRSLGRKGLKPIVIITNAGGKGIMASKYVGKGYSVEGSEEALALLNDSYSHETPKPIIIACHDIISSLLDLNRDRLLKYFVLPGSSVQGRVTEIMNKQKMAALAEQVRMNIPLTMVLNSSSDITEVQLTMPCITKPLASRDGSKQEIKICHNKEELHSFLIEGEGRDFLVQQYIDKDIEFQLIGCSLNDGVDVIIPGVSVIIRQPANTNTGFLHYMLLDSTFRKTVEATKQFLRKIQYNGLFSAEFLRGKDGVDYFMEVNLRNDGNAIAVTNAGVNLPYIWYLASSGLEYQKEICPVHDEYVMPEFAELDLFASRSITKKLWKEDMRMATSYMDYAEDDPEPTEGWKKYNKAKYQAYIKRLLNYFIKRK